MRRAAGRPLRRTPGSRRAARHAPSVELQPASASAPCNAAREPAGYVARSTSFEPITLQCTTTISIGQDGFEQVYAANMTKPRTIALERSRGRARARADRPSPRTRPAEATDGKAAAGAAAGRRRSTSRRSRKNLARMVEEGGKALAAYLKPREEGEVKTEPADEIADMVKTLGQVAEYWLSDPQRAVELQTGARQGLSRPLGARRPSAWPARTPRRWSRPTRATSASPIPNGRRTSSSISSSRPICSPRSWAERPGRGRRRARRAHPAQGRVLRASRSPTRSRRRTSC